ncbi:MAG: SPOR domain-containing protein [Pseudomonadota bacterium]
MARDYKNTPRPNSKKNQKPGSWLSFISGLGLGLVIAIFVYLWGAALPPPPQIIQKSGVYDIPIDESPNATKPPSSVALPKPKFDFYKILPQMEVRVPDWEISPEKAATQSALAPGTYVLQVGSFKKFQDADRAKAELALEGITATIQRVVINGQDIWFRVHVGPFSQEQDLLETRTRLIEHGRDFILLRIGEAADA